MADYYSDELHWNQKRGRTKKTNTPQSTNNFFSISIMDDATLNISYISQV